MKTHTAYNRLVTIILVATVVLQSCSKTDDTVSMLEPPVPQSNLPERIISDTAYGTNAKQKMDIYLPARRTNQTKLIVMVHGGSWVEGDKNDVNNFVSLFRAKWPECAIANINYRLANGTTVTYSNIMDDIKSAVNLMVNNKSNFNISDTIALWGSSAGAHLALQYTYTTNNAGNIKCVADVYGPAKINDWEWYKSVFPLNVKDIFTKLSGSGWDAELYNNLSPIETVTPTSKPTIIFHGNLDFVVPIYQSQWFKSRLDQLGVHNEYHEYTDFHGFTAENNADCVNKTVAFFKKHLK